MRRPGARVHGGGGPFAKADVDAQRVEPQPVTILMIVTTRAWICRRWHAPARGREPVDTSVTTPCRRRAAVRLGETSKRDDKDPYPLEHAAPNPTESIDRERVAPEVYGTNSIFSKAPFRSRIGETSAQVRSRR